MENRIIGAFQAFCGIFVFFNVSTKKEKKNRKKNYIYAKAMLPKGILEKTRTFDYN